MKKTIALILSLLTCLGLLSACGGMAPTPAEPAAAETPAPEAEAPGAETAAPVPAEEESLPLGGGRFVGEWSDEYSQRALLTVLPAEAEGQYLVTVHWGDTAASFAQWTMTASYDESGDCLRYADGSRAYVTLQESGEEQSETTWSGSEGRFVLDGDALRWEDSKEEAAEDTAFIRVTTYAPAAEELLEGFFRPVAELPFGTAGASLKQAAVACETLRFAQTYAVWCNEPAELDANLKEAWTALSEEEQTAFAERLDDLRSLVADSAASWTDYAGLFEDAGVGEDMQTLRADRSALQSFRLLLERAEAVCLGQG